MNSNLGLSRAKGTKQGKGMGWQSQGEKSTQRQGHTKCKKGHTEGAQSTRNGRKEGKANTEGSTKGRTDEEGRQEGTEEKRREGQTEVAESSFS